jgi:hypothetical protein
MESDCSLSSTQRIVRFGLIVFPEKPAAETAGDSENLSVNRNSGEMNAKAVVVSCKVSRMLMANEVY